MDSLLTSLLRKRESVIPPDTSVFRVLDGRGDGFPDVFIDRLGDRWLVATRDCGIPSVLRKELEATGEPVYHKRLDKDNKEAPVQWAGPECASRFLVKEQGVSLWLDTDTGYSQGLFLDQRDNRERVRRLVRPGDRVLNTFSYTGAFSVYAALAGAVTTTLDLAQPCLDWAKENMTANGIDPAEHFFCKGDTLHWLGRFARQERFFRGIILDPPTFSRDRDGNVWRVERDYGRLVSLAASCLVPGGWMLCTTNCRKLSHAEFLEQIREATPPGTRLETGRMPADFTGEPYLKIVWIFLPAKKSRR